MRLPVGLGRTGDYDALDANFLADLQDCLEVELQSLLTTTDCTSTSMGKEAPPSDNYLQDLFMHC